LCFSFSLSCGLSICLFVFVLVVKGVSCALAVPQVLGALVNAVCLVSMAVYLILAALPALVAAPGATTTFQPTPAFLGVATVGVRE
jgi:hypothetical protein